MGKKKSPIPSCPYCDDDSGECEHVLVNYDRSFGEYLSGYLSKKNPEMDAFEAEMIELIEQGIKPIFNDYDYELESIWESAIDSYDKEDRYWALDSTPYFKLLEETAYNYDCESFRYPDNDYVEEEDDAEDLPGYSSAGIIFYAKDPAKTIKEFNEGIIADLKP